MSVLSDKKKMATSLIQSIIQQIALVIGVRDCIGVIVFSVWKEMVTLHIQSINQSDPANLSFKSVIDPSV